MDSLPLIYCAKCRKRTPTANKTDSESVTGRPMQKGECKVCGTRKSTFVRMNLNKKEDAVSESDSV